MKSETVGWSDYVVKTYDFAEFPRGALVLDVGCGSGQQLLELQQRGCRPVGLDVTWECVAKCRERGAAVLLAHGEAVSLRSSSVDGVVCKVVVPYTDERKLVHEIGRVLKPGGIAHLCSHGVGYYLRYILCAGPWKGRVYGIRSLLNTWIYAVTGFRLPGFLGDTLFQSHRRLARYYREAGLELEKETPSRSFVGRPVFIYHRVLRGKNGE